MNPKSCILERPFRLPISAEGRFSRPIANAARSVAERVLGLNSINSVYDHAHNDRAQGSFAERVLRTLNVSFDAAQDDLGRIPRTGPLIVVANHPFGGLDGLVLAALLHRVRPDAKLLVNYLLGCMAEMHEACFFVDPFGGPTAKARNRSVMKSAIRWVDDGGVLGVFPAGEVSHYTLKQGCITDPRWSDTVARMVHRTQACVLPIFFEGRNSRVFQVAGLLHPRFRTAMLARELLRKQGQTIHVHVGRVIPASRLARLCEQPSPSATLTDSDASEITNYLRLRTYILRGRRPPAIGRSAKAPIHELPIVSPQTPNALAREISELPADQCLAASGDLSVYVAAAHEIPSVLQEIGRLRESTFRLVGEGTGREIDLDRFDSHYLHLFVWSVNTRQIVGAYRMGRTDNLLKQFGTAGLYTSTLFKFRPELLSQLGAALELGRSFVIPEYQKDYAPLMLLWKGIGRYVAANPRYRRLFGAVSISDDFHSMTKQLLIAFLHANYSDARLSELVHARNPPKLVRIRDVDERRLSAIVSDIANVEELVEEIESGARRIPVLLRQYLKLNAKILGFNVDPDFGDVVDGLVLADLVTVDRSILNRYLGREGATAFLAFHRGTMSAPTLSA